MRRLSSALVLWPTVLAGLLGAHSVANSVAGGPHGADELFGSPHTGAGLVPLLAVAAALLVLFGVVGRVLVGRAPAGLRLTARRLAALSLGGFVALELGEWLASSATGGSQPLLTTSFLLGLLLQLPFACGAYAGARTLLALGDLVRAWISARPGVVRTPITLAHQPLDGRMPWAVVVSVRRSRGPPLRRAVRA
jgi:hypothetical protein